MQNHIRLKQIHDMSRYIENHKVVDVRQSTRNRILVLCIVNGSEAVSSEYLNAETSNKFSYRIIEIEDHKVNIIDIKDQKYDYDFVQNLEENYLLSGSRCRYYSKDQQDKNAKIINRKGEVLNEFTIGDGIQDVYVTDDNIIWVSYFDEGVYGNYGWDDPLGKSGLVAFDRSGELLYEFDNGWIDDCYSLNITDENQAWIYYYSSFEIAQVKVGSVIKQFNPKCQSANGIIIYNDFVMLKKTEDFIEKCYLYKRNSNDELKLLKEFKISIEVHEGRLFYSCRGSRIIYLINKNIYQFDLDQIEEKNGLNG